MKLSIFSRMMIGYLAIFILVMAVSLYATLVIRRINDQTQHILLVDSRILQYEKKMSDSVLSQSRFERKFALTRDRALHDQFLSARDSFSRMLAEALTIVDTPPKRQTLEELQKHFEDYQSVVDEEMTLARSNQDYRKKEYDQAKDRQIDLILDELQVLGVQSQQDIVVRMETLGEIGALARRIVLGMAVATVALVLLTSFFITRAITRPLQVLVDKTRDISNGVFEPRLTISSPPEISELAGSFNMMCEKLRELDKLKSDFFASMSHELRTPLTSIREGVSLLKDGVGGSIPDKQKRLLTILSQEANRLIELVNSLLDLSKMEAGMMSYAFETSSLFALVDRATTEMTPLIESRRIRLDRKGFEGLPSIRMDKERMLQVLRNLLGNAVKFTPDGGHVTISGRQVNHEVEVSVKDTGPGIPSEKLSTIFDKYQQAGTGSPYRAKGTGLGLSIAKHVISSHGGRIWAESKSGEGSTFTFVLPV